ncbi:MAG: hypothetical protein O7C65_05250 [Planctomycetota bacterium]|nr:hypothetical protein [Planctomycetota bacterium]
MTAAMFVVTIVLLLAAIVLLVLLVRRDRGREVQQLTSSLAALGESQEVAEASLRDEIDKSREAAGARVEELRRELRQEVTASLKSATDTVVEAVGELEKGQEEIRRSLQDEIGKSRQAADTWVQELSQEVTSSLKSATEAMAKTAAGRSRSAVPFARVRTIDPFRVLRRHLVMIIGSGVVGIGLGVAAFFLFDRFLPRYRSEVLFEIQSGLDEARDISSRDLTRDELVMRLASTESMLLTSRGVLMAAVRERDVQATSWFRQAFVGADGALLIDEAVDDLEEDVSTRLIRGSNLFGLRWSAGVAGDVHIVLNSIARSYIGERQDLDDSIYNRNLEVFRTELNQTTRDLDDLAQEIEVFIRDKGITSLEDPRSNQTAMAVQELGQRMGESSSTLSLIQSAYLQTAAKLEGTVEPTEDDRRLAAEKPAVRPHELAVLQSKTILRELREQYRDPEHWLIGKQEARLRALELEYEAKIEEIMTANLQAQLNELSNQIESLTTMLDELQTEYEEKDDQLRTLAADIAMYQAMEGRRDHLESTRDFDLELIKDLRLMRARADASRVRITQLALRPREKAFPKVEVVVPLTTLLLVGLVTGLVFLRELTDQRIKSASDLELLPAARVLGMIPELQEDPCRSESAELVVCKCPNSVLAESYRQLCTRIDEAMSRAGHKTLLLVGGLPEAGTTTVATNLAAAAVAVGRKVAIIDANFRRPRLDRAMGISVNGSGLGELLIDDIPLDQAITGTEYGIDIIAAGKPTYRIYERLNGGRFDRLLAELGSRYDLVLVDTPPAVVAGDAMVLANKLDAAVLVVRAYQEQRGLVARLIDQLSDAQCELLGVVLNRPRGTAGGYFKKNFATMARYANEEAA